MFTFFGLFADPVSGLPEQISRIWPDLNIVSLEQPISAVAVRFGQHLYEPPQEDTPEPVVRTIETLSEKNPDARFLLLRTECWGGQCADWGQVIQNGATTFQADGEGALRRLIKYWGVDLGPQEIFEPLRRDFQWDASRSKDR
jgi:hypothetical protein